MVREVREGGSAGPDSHTRPTQARLFETAVQLEMAGVRRAKTTGDLDATPLMNVEVHLHDSDHCVAVHLREGGRLDALLLASIRGGVEDGPTDRH